MIDVRHVDLCQAIAKITLGFGTRAYQHSLRVASIFHEPFHKCLAILHDVIEDTSAEADDLAMLGVDERIITWVEVLTHGSNQNYQGYIQEIADTDIILIRIKIADIMDNLTDEPSEKARMKYRKALEVLLPKLL